MDAYLSNATPAFIENLYQRWKEDPESIDLSWQRFFEGFDFAEKLGASSDSYSTAVSGAFGLENNVLNLIHGYRTRGHLFTNTNPVRKRRDYQPKLSLENFGLSEADLDTVFEAGRDMGIGAAKLSRIIEVLNTTYCNYLGIEYRHLGDPRSINWLQSRMEKNQNIPKFSIAKKQQILHKIFNAVEFEQFLGRKYVGQKRFSLEGGEGLIPALDAVIEKGAALGIEEFVIGMAHRGRLSVLSNILQKEYDLIFSEFEGQGHEDAVFQGDVKYHMGFSSDVVTSEGKNVHLSLMPNPSHLETVSGVVEGAARAKIDHKYGQDFKKLAPILIHGDAAVAGQGVVYEIIQMSKLDGYKTGGTIHIVINNQVGFTTNYLDARSSTYCTDVAKVTRSPIFHVNGDDVESLVLAIELAMEFRQEFHRDVFIDLLCYRRHGHNEADEAGFTQPKLYSIIKKHPNPYKIYTQKLQEEGLLTKEIKAKLEKDFKAELQLELEEAKQREHLEYQAFLKGTWDGIKLVDKLKFDQNMPETGIAVKTLEHIVDRVHHIPENFTAHKKIIKLFKDRLKMVKENRLDWALGELLAYGSLLLEGKHVRLSGQDVRRGTFSHRHAYLTSVDMWEEKDQRREETYVPLNNISKGQAEFVAYNSLLSEYGVLAFEYGYSMTNPNNVVIWEAQFGDFANGAQIVMDQYISCSETKWQRMSGLVQLLPHGFEGQGPEHSSARIERYLNLCARKNMQVMNLTTPANFFHAMRRQHSWDFRIPLIIFTPKKLLRYPKAVSPLSDFGPESRFHAVIDDAAIKRPKAVKRILVCSGKIYYDLLEKQEAENRKDVAIVRLEQLYPLPEVSLRKVVARYGADKEYVWVQEEPRNMGPWSYILRVLTDVRPLVVARKPSPSPATGDYKRHEKEQAQLVEAAFNRSFKDGKSIETRVLM